MSNWITDKKEKTEFRDIVLEHLKKILEITRQEFRGGYIQKKVVGGIVEEIYIPDTRKQYIQSIESLSDILLGFFDNKMKEKSKSLIKKTKEELKNFEDSGKEIGSEEHNKYIIKKLKFMREVFKELNLLLHRKDYLKAKIYEEVEGEDEDDEDDEDDVVDVDE